MIFCNVVYPGMYMYVRNVGEKFGGCWRSFSRLGQKVTDNKTYMHSSR